VDSGLLSTTHHNDFTLPVVVLVVGLQFLPLAWLFGVWQYYATGALLGLVAIASVLAILRTVMVNHMALWVAVPATHSALVLWLTAIVVLLAGRQTVQGWTDGQHVARAWPRAEASPETSPRDDH
jgi:hypothetical protein